MWTKKLIGPSSEYPNRTGLINFLIQQLIEKEVNSAWVHIELVKENGFLKNIFSGQQPFAETAFANSQFEINLGFQKNIPKVPSHWQKSKNGFQKIPRSDLQMLCEAIDSFLGNSSNSENYKIIGWIDGL